MKKLLASTLAFVSVWAQVARGGALGDYLSGAENKRLKTWRMLRAARRSIAPSLRLLLAKPGAAIASSFSRRLHLRGVVRDEGYQSFVSCKIALLLNCCITY